MQWVEAGGISSRPLGTASSPDTMLASASQEPTLWNAFLRPHVRVAGSVGVTAAAPLLAHTFRLTSTDQTVSSSNVNVDGNHAAHQGHGMLAPAAQREQLQQHAGGDSGVASASSTTGASSLGHKDAEGRWWAAGVPQRLGSLRTVPVDVDVLADSTGGTNGTVVSTSALAQAPTGTGGNTTVGTINTAAGSGGSGGGDGGMAWLVARKRRRSLWRQAALRPFASAGISAQVLHVLHALCIRCTVYYCFLFCW